MALDNFIPELWANRLKVELRKRLVFAQSGVVNRDYQGQIRRQGDTVHIHTFSDLTVEDYSKNTDMSAPETLDDSRQSLEITEAKNVNFQIDDIDKAQQTPKIMTAAMDRASYQLADVLDQYVAEGLDEGGVADEGDDEYETLVNLGVKLDEENVPRSGRWVIIPPFFHGGLLKDSRFVSSGDGASESARLNGQVGRAAGFNVLVSNNAQVESGTPDLHSVVAGHPLAYTVAEQLTNVEAYRPERRHADAVKMLHVYGGLLVNSDAIAVVQVER